MEPFYHRLEKHSNLCAIQRVSRAWKYASRFCAAHGSRHFSLRSAVLSGLGFLFSLFLPLKVSFCEILSSWRCIATESRHAHYNRHLKLMVLRVLNFWIMVSSSMETTSCSCWTKTWLPHVLSNSGTPRNQWSEVPMIKRVWKPAIISRLVRTLIKVRQVLSYGVHELA